MVVVAGLHAENPPLCPFDFVAVEKQGYTCDLNCYSAWILHWAAMVRPDGLHIIPDDADVPLSLPEQPWWLDEFPDEDKPKVVD